MFEKLGVPVNKLTNKIGSEAFWPSSLDNESDKSARILKSFCSKSFPSPPNSEISHLTMLQRMAFIRSSLAVLDLLRGQRANLKCWSRFHRRLYRTALVSPSSQSCGPACGYQVLEAQGCWLLRRRMGHGHHPLDS